ncbi:MAG: hypothetical protein OXI66_20010, partial [Boseongicola sp.]|nr:hypothetical protein [Boseongicola sp.]
PGGAGIDGASLMPSMARSSPTTRARDVRTRPQQAHGSRVSISDSSQMRKLTKLTALTEFLLIKLIL